MKKILLVGYCFTLFGMEQEVPHLLKRLSTELYCAHGLTIPQIREVRKVLQSRPQFNKNTQWCAHRIEYSNSQDTKYATIITNKTTRALKDMAVYLVGTSVKQFGFHSIFENPGKCRFELVNVIFTNPTQAYFVFGYQGFAWDEDTDSFQASNGKILRKGQIDEDHSIISLSSIAACNDRERNIQLYLNKEKQVICNATYAHLEEYSRQTILPS